MDQITRFDFMTALLTDLGWPKKLFFFFEKYHIWTLSIAPKGPKRPERVSIFQFLSEKNIRLIHGHPTLHFV